MGRTNRSKTGPSLSTLAIAGLVVVVMVAAVYLGMGRLSSSPNTAAETDTGGGTNEESQVTPQYATEEQLLSVRRAVGTTGIVALGIDRFRVRLGRYPRNLQELLDKPDDLASGQRWDGPYVNNPRLLSDPWGQSYRYKSPGDHHASTYDLWSVGPDGINASSDDIGNW